MSLQAWAHLAVFAPLIAFFAMLLGLRALRGPMVATSLMSATLAAVATWMLVLNTPEGGAGSTVVWAATEDFALHFGYRLTGLSTAMAAVVATVHLLVQLYSVGYMADDPGKARFFGILSLFASVMLGLVLAADLAQTFVCWELVGLASYLLIGFWGHKPSAAQAAKKAFIMTRFGDIGLFCGLVLLLNKLGELRIDTVLAAVQSGALAGEAVTTIGLLLLCGIAGKSAQFPLHTWLPDAMEGPTPVSSLLHSATMVAAGVYLFALLQPLFLASETTQTVALSLAVGTAILSAGVAMVERDMKRVLAWSSISQLSFMLMGLAAGSAVAGFFHLITHAGFKCLLFLSAGLFIHLAHSGDLYDIGARVGRSSRAATFGLVVGALSLAGVPLLAGFMSKELVLAALHHEAPVLYYGALLASAMTAYYAFRLLALALFAPRAADPEEQRGPDAHSGAHEEHAGPMKVMSGVVVALGVVTLGLGWIGPQVALLLGASADAAHIHWASSGVGLAIGALLLGAAGAWLDFGPRATDRQGFPTRVPALHRLLQEQWYVDRFWRWVSEALVAGLTAAALFVDRKGVDGVVDGVGEGTKKTGGIAAALQTGRLQLYVSISLGLLAVFMLVAGMR